MKIFTKRIIKKQFRTIKILLIGLSMILSVLATTIPIRAVSNTEKDGYVTVDKTATKVAENKFKIDLKINTGEAPDITTSIGSDIVMVMDVSTSMHNNRVAPSNKTRIRVAVDAAVKFLTDLNDPKKQNRYGVVTFNGNYLIKQELSNDKQEAIDAINGLVTSNDQIAPGAGSSQSATNIQSGFYAARTMLDEIQSKNGIIILLSDGQANRAYQLNQSGNDIYRRATKKDKDLGFTKSNVVLNQGTYSLDDVISYNQTVGRTNFDATLMAENEALHAKLAGYTAFTIGFATSVPGLQRMATPSNDNDYYYTANSNLNAIYAQISKTITTQFGTMINGGTVIDPMSNYVELLNLADGTYSNEIAGGLEVSRGQVTVSSVNGKQTITWNVGDIAKNSEATLSYYVSLKDEYRDGNLYDANDPTNLSYVDHQSIAQNIDFPIPQISEVTKIKSATLTIKKIVENNLDGKEFIVHVVGSDASGIIYRTDLLLKNNDEVMLENLPFGNYVVNESALMENSLNKVQNKYLEGAFIDGNAIILNQDNHQGYIQLTNTFKHVGYFKDNDEKTNYLPASENTINNYKYNLSGNVKSTTSKNPQDVILVLDRSGSMTSTMGDSNRIAVLKNNVINFIKKLYQHNPNSRVSIITFANNTDTSITNDGFVKLSDTYRGLETWYTYLTKGYGGIDSINASGGTMMDLGLYQARNQLAKATGSNNKSVILFTDGEPGNSGLETSNTYYKNGYRVGAETINQAEFIKGKGALTAVNNYMTRDFTNYYGHGYDDITSYRSSDYNNNMAGNRNRMGTGLNKTLFVIGTNSGDSVEFDNFLIRVASTNKYTKANDANAMTNAFDDIFTGITSMETDVNIRLKYDATKYKVINRQGGVLGGSGSDAYIEWTGIIDETTGEFAVNGIEFKNIVANPSDPILSIEGYKNNIATKLDHSTITKVSQ